MHVIGWRVSGSCRNQWAPFLDKPVWRVVSPERWVSQHLRSEDSELPPPTGERAQCETSNLVFTVLKMKG